MENTALPLYRYIDEHLPDFVQTLICICEIPAPTFQEETRAKFLASLFRILNHEPEIDQAGNVIIPIFTGGLPHLVLSAHLDTVFDFDSIQVKRENFTLRAPGISDDSAGLAALVLIARALRETSIPLRGSLTMLATVGEEGLGNLRGSRQFFESRTQPVDYFISLDGADAERIVTTGIASKRLRISFQGPGGHSWGDAGMVNPIHIAGLLLSQIQGLALPQNPKTVLSVGVIRGGTSVNTIPPRVFMDIDLRSESASEMRRLDEFLRSSVAGIASQQPSILTEMQVLGERPSGSIEQNHALVKSAIEANLRHGLAAKLDTGSTDSNIPLSLGVPAITIGVGGKSGKIHTPEEWYDIENVSAGLKRTSLLITELLHL